MNNNEDNKDINPTTIFHVVDEETEYEGDTTKIMKIVHDEDAFNKNQYNRGQKWVYISCGILFVCTLLELTFLWIFYSSTTIMFIDLALKLLIILWILKGFVYYRILAFPYVTLDIMIIMINVRYYIGTIVFTPVMIFLILKEVLAFLGWGIILRNKDVKYYLGGNK